MNPPRLSCAPPTKGNHSDIWVGLYDPAEAYRFTNETWTSFTGGGVTGNKDTISALDTMRDICSVAIDPNRCKPCVSRLSWRGYC